MSELTTIPATELADLRERLSRLAREKADLQLVALLMNRLGELPGLEKTVEGMLQFVMDILGGLNVTLYYRLDGAIHRIDVHGRKEVVGEIADDIVRQVFETRELVSREREFSQTGMTTQEFTKATTWVMPLLVGTELVGVLRMDDLLVAGRELRDEVQTFLRYASLVLKHEIAGETRLQKAFKEVSRANHELTYEVAERRRAEAALQRAKDELEQRVAERTAELASRHSTLRGIVEGTTSPIFSVDTHYRYVAYNASHASVMQALYGAEIEIGCSILDCMTVSDDRETVRANLDRALTGEHLVESANSGEELRERRYFEVAYHPVLADDGQIVGVAVFANDTTERRYAQQVLRESEEKFAAAFRASPNLLAITRMDDGTILDVNEGYSRLLGYSRDESIGRTTAELAIWADADDRATFVRTLAEGGEIVDFETRLRRKDASMVTVLDSARTIRLQVGTCVLSIAHDITQRKQAERRMRRDAERTSVLFDVFMRSSELPEEQVFDEVLDLAVRLTESAVGFFHQVSDNQKTVILTTWNKDALRDCSAAYDTHYPIDVAGNWADCVRLGRAVVHNDFAASPNQNGLPPGHVPVRRFMSVPVVEGGQVRIVFGVGNKESDYDDDDVVQVQEIANELLKIVVQRRASEHARFLGRLYRTISEINQVIVREKSRDSLLAEVCRIGVEHGGFAMVWAGLADVPGGTVRPMAAAGLEAGYADEMEIRLDAPPVELRPAARAIVEDRVVVVDDTETDPGFAPWRETARRRGFLSCAAFPIRADGDVRGVLKVYATEVGAFHGEVVALLTELAADLGFSLHALEVEDRRALAEMELVRVNRALRMLSETNEAVIRLEDEAALLKEACRIAVDVGSSRLAWVGLVEHDEERTLRPVAHAGADSEYVESARVTWADNERGRGPGGTSVRTGEPSIVRSVPTDPAFAPWRDAAVRRGFKSIISLPLISEGQTLGAMLIYAGDEDAFDTEEVGILKKLVADLAYGITSLRTRAEHARMRQQLQSDVEFFESMDLANRAIPGAQSLDQMMNDVLETVLSIFDCDRAWLFYPCDPDAPSFRVPMEVTRPGYPGAGVLNVDVPMPPDMAENLREALESANPLTYTVGTQRPINRVSAEQFGVQSQMMVALYPKPGRPWVFGLHQCSHPRVWTSDEQRLFREIGRRLADALTGMLSHRDLQESEARYRSLFEANADGILVVDSETGAFKSANPTLCRMVGYSEDELKALDLPAIHPKGDLERVAAEFWDLARGVKTLTCDIPCLRKDGSIFYADISSTNITIDGRPHSVGFFRDITERKRLDTELRRLAAGIEQAAESIVVTDIDGTIQYVNPAFSRLTGYSREEAVGQNPRILKGGTHPPEHYQELWAKLTQGEVWHGHLINRRKDGSLFEEDATISPVRDEAGRTVQYVAVKRDVTQEVALQAQLLQAQKMEAVGSLAGGIAHDFNNLLQSMLSHTQLLLRLCDSPQRVAALSKGLEQEVTRGAALTRQLLLFSRRETVKPEQLDLTTVVQDLTGMLRRLVRASIALSTELAPQALPVKADRGQLTQVLMNLVVNASDAMPDGGTLVVRTGQAESGEVWLAVQDTGCGIPEAIREHLFEPFFTTKSAGQGTGLGLPVVHGIVTKHGGRIEIESAVGIGSTFKIFLPRAASGEHPHVEEAQPGNAVPRVAEGEGEWVLVVEDEDSAREGLQELLTELGYEVVAVASGEEAGRLPTDRPFDVLLTDLMLPGVGGPALADGLRERWPTLKVVLMSGYTEDEAVRRGVKEGEVHFLQKPFDVETLARELRAVLSG